VLGSGKGVGLRVSDEHGLGQGQYWYGLSRKKSARIAADLQARPDTTASGRDPTVQRLSGSANGTLGKASIFC